MISKVFRFYEMKKMLLMALFISWNSLAVNASEKGLTVYFFLSESCPICQSTTLEIKKICKDFESDDIKFIGLFPNQTNSTANSRSRFSQKYELNFLLVADSSQKLTKKFDATITPEVIVIENNNQTIIYRGKVDNSFESVGKRRAVVTEFYLRQALNFWKNGKVSLIKNTIPVGCYIQQK